MLDPKGRMHIHSLALFETRMDQKAHALVRNPSMKKISACALGRRDFGASNLAGNSVGIIPFETSV